MYRKEYNEHPFITHPNATVVSILLYLLYYFVYTHTHTHTHKIGLDIVCIVSDYSSIYILRIRTLPYIITISLSHLKVNNNATISSLKVIRPTSFLYSLRGGI